MTRIIVLFFAIMTWVTFADCNYMSKKSQIEQEIAMKNAIVTNYMSKKLQVEHEIAMRNAILTSNTYMIGKLINDVHPNTIYNKQTMVSTAVYHLINTSPISTNALGLSIIEFLLNNGGDPCLVNAEGMTPYEYYMTFIWFYPDSQVKKLLDVCNRNNIHHVPKFEHCAKYYGNTKQYSECTLKHLF